MADISGFGARIQIVASNTFPTGFSVTQFADDADPIDIPSLQIGDKASGVNGDLIAWSKANPIVATLNVIPESEDDVNLGILVEANRVAKNKRGAQDVITMIIQYPKGNATTFIKGYIQEGMPATGIQSSGRLKTKSYMFTFENLIRT